jgi:hypothetical protein
MAQFKKGDKVRQIMAEPIEGRIDDFTIDKETGDPQLHVSWETTEPGGIPVTHGHWFKDSEVESVK